MFDSETVPDRIGPYDVIRPLAQGGMAIVYEALDVFTGERHALKVLVHLESSISRFNREFEAMTRLNHPSIVRVYRYGVHDGHPWISMELLEGVPLQRQVKHLGFPGSEKRNREVLRIGMLLCHALQYIHDRGIVHRDLKSANVQVLADGRVKLLDFGTAHLLDPLERITRDGDFVGTFSYASPEQVLGTPVDHKADLYSLGILLYRLSTGRRPFKSDDPKTLARMQLKQEPRPPRELVPELPPGLEALILELLRKERRERPESALSVANRLERISGGRIPLPEETLALDPERSLARQREHRQLWDALEQADGVLLDGGDELERARFARQVCRDAEARKWVPWSAESLEEMVAWLPQWVRGMGRVSPEQAQLMTAMADLKGEELARAFEVVAAGLAGVVPESEARHLFVLSRVERWSLTARLAVLSLSHAFRSAQLPVSWVVTAQSTSSARRFLPPTSVIVHIRFAALDPAATALATGELLHRRRPDMRLGRRLYEASGGRPTLLTEVVSTLVEREVLCVRASDGNRLEWAREEGAQLHLPDSAVRALHEGLASLPVAGRRVLEVLAVAGEPLFMETIAAVLGWSQDELQPLIEILAEQCWVTLKSDEAQIQVTANAPLTLRFLSERLNARRRRVIELALVERMPDDAASANQVEILASVGRSVMAVRRAVLVARRSLDNGDLRSAQRSLEAVWDMVDRASVPDPLRAEIRLVMGHVLHRIQPLDPRGVRALAEAARLSKDEHLLAAVSLGQAEVHDAIGHYGSTRRHLLEAWEQVEGEQGTPLKSDIALQLALNHLDAGQLSESMTWLDHAMTSAEEAGHAQRILRAQTARARVEAVKGHIESATQKLKRLHERAKDHASERLAILAVWAGVARLEGRFSEILSLLDPALSEARKQADVPTLVGLLSAAAAVELDLGRLGRAQEHTDELLALVGAGERLRLRLNARLLQGRILLYSGQAERAAFVLDEVVQQANLARLVVLVERGRASLGEATVAMGQVEEGNRLIQSAMMGLAGTGHRLALGEAVIARARALGSDAAADRAFRLIGPLMADPGAVVFRLERAIVSLRGQRDPAAVQEARIAAETMMRTLVASQDDSVAAALRVHPWTRELNRARL